MSGTFWEPQPEEEVVPDQRKPVWAWLITAVDLLIVLAVIPVVILVVAPFLVLYYVYLAYVLVWVSPVLLGANALLFGWAVRRRFAGMAALSILSVLLLLLSGVLLVLWGAPITVFGLTF